MYAQVGFQDQNLLLKTNIPARKNEVVNRLEKTKKWALMGDFEADFVKRMEEEKVQILIFLSQIQAQVCLRGTVRIT